MQKQLWDFILAHQTAIILFLGWNFSALMSSMPPQDPKAGYLWRWTHDYLQLVAANMNKRVTPPPPPMEPVPPPLKPEV